MNDPIPEPDLRPLIKQALLKLETAQKKLRALEEARTAPIAIVGLGCRLPGGVTGSESYWQLLRNGVDAIQEVPGDRWKNEDYYDANPEEPGKAYTRFGGFIDSPKDFDADFFNISPREAASLDPQQRLLLEVTWEALEHAGIPAEKLAGSQAGVFVGVCTHDYGNLLMSRDPVEIDAYLASGTSHSVAAGRLSYFLGLEGPSLAVDTACSSSMVAIHLACQSLRNQECSLALAGGVNRILSPEFTINFCKARMLAPDGRCKTFDAAADGFVRGEGCGMIVLKRLSDAVADGDNVLAVIRGSAVNQDGHTSGLTVPHGPSQRAVIRQALKNAGLEPLQVGYVEAHGTGTALGDPIEMGALGAVYGKDRTDPLQVGSVKTNIGHLEAAAGVAGLIKVVLALQRQEIPRHLHFQTPNPLIPWQEWAIEIAREPKPWPAGKLSRIAGISSFGFSGTNAHLILEESPVVAPPQKGSERPVHLLTVSARTEKALRESARRIEAHLTDRPEESLADICYTANAGRSHFEHRLALAGSSSEEMRASLARFEAGEKKSGFWRGIAAGDNVHKIAFLFTGQGAEYAGMGRQLYETQPLFRKTLERCADLLRPYLERPLLDVLYAKDFSNAWLSQTAYVQPALFALECALAEVWRSWGILPAAVLGHGVGEYAAAYMAGVFTLEEGCMLAAERALLMQSLLRDGGTLFEDSSRTQPMLNRFRQAASQIAFSVPRLGLIANVTGELANGEISFVEYWVDQLRKPVQFSSGMAALRRHGYDLFVEIGPQPTLLGMGRECSVSGGGIWLPSLNPDRSDWSQMLESLAELYVHGARVDWAGFDRDYPRRRVVLPAYPFQRQSYWAKTEKARSARIGSKPDQANTNHPLLDRRLVSALETIQFESQWSAGSPSYLQDHRVFGNVTVPTSVYIEAILAAGSEIFPGRTFVFEQMATQLALVLAENESRTVQLLFDSEDPETVLFKIASLDSEKGHEKSAWTLHASGKIHCVPNSPVSAPMDLGALRNRCGTELQISEFYRSYQERGVDFGTGFQAVRQIFCGEGESLGRVQLPQSLISEVEQYRLHPVLIDACCQVLGAALPEAVRQKTFLQIGIERLRFQSNLGTSVWSHVRLRPIDQAGGPLTVDVQIFDDAGALLAELEGVSLVEATRESLVRRQSKPWHDWLYEIEWRPQPGSQPAAISMPMPQDILSELNRRWDGLQGEMNGSQLQGLLSKLERLSLLYIVRAFSELGCDTSGHQRLSFEAFARTLRVVPRHERLLGRLLSILQEEGFLRLAGSEWKWIKNSSGEDPEAHARAILSQYPSAKAELEILRRCGSKLAESLRGKCEPLELLFPASVDLTAADIYLRSPGARLMNALAQSAARSVLSRLTPGKVFRILEIGAGTGGTTASILPILPAGETEYVFTDISPLFLAQAKEKFATYPFVRYQQLNIEQAPASSEFQRYDFVIAANVLHATRDVRETLTHVRQLLVPGGLLLLLESTAPKRWVDLIFGLTDGWWRFADQDLRPSHPLLSVDQWQQVLEETGFEKTAPFAPDCDATEVLCKQALLIARTPEQKKEPQRLESRRWLIFADASGVGAHLQKQLQAEGAAVHLVFRGTEYLVIDPTTCQIDPLDSAHFQQLLQSVANTGRAPLSGIVHLWSLDAAPASELTLSQLNQASVNGCGSALHLVQATVQAGFSSPPPLFFVTCGVHSERLKQNGVAQEISVAQAPLWGLAKTVALEHPELRCRLLDLESFQTSSDMWTAAVRVHQELENSHGADEGQIAYRNGERCVSRLKRIIPDTARPHLSLRPDATYLITGGLGSMGFLVAQWMVERGARSLVLLGRREPDAALLEACRSLERAGATISILRADVSREDEMRAVIERIRSSMPPLRGIIHGAGVYDDRMIRVHQWDLFEKVFAPKVLGSWNLHILTRDIPLDFFVLFSSQASMFGASGLGNYVAANAFLDALAHYRRQIGLPGSSINWGVWKKVGMAGSVGDKRVSQWDVHGIRPMEPRPALDALEMMLARNVTQAGVLRVDWEKYLSQFPIAAPKFFEAMARSSHLPRQTQDAFVDRLKAAPAENQRELLTAHVRSQVAGVLGLPQSETIDSKRGFFEMGMDSLTSMELRNRLQTSLRCPLPSTLVFKYPKVEALAEYLAAETLLLKPLPVKAPSAEVPAADAGAAAASLDTMSEDELANLLSQKLAGMNGGANA